MPTGLLYHPRCLDHDPGPGHPEKPERLMAIMQHLETQPWFSRCVRRFDPAATDSTRWKKSIEEWICEVHSADYLRRAEEACRWGRRCLDTPDVGISEDSFDVAKLTVGGALTLADEVMSGNIQNGFAALRPPGHHAEKDYAMGFCLFNNIAILARYLQGQHGLDKILILDWDVHHGNGTQHTFEEDPSVLYVSLHQYPFYPGTGAASETGIGCGKGATLNCPMPAGSGDEDYCAAFREKILPKIGEFKPEAVLISAGFDAHAQDPLAHIQLSTGFFAWLSERMMETADKFSAGRLISLLEGGYNLKVLPECVASHLEVLSRKEKA